MHESHMVAHLRIAMTLVANFSNLTIHPYHSWFMHVLCITESISWGSYYILCKQKKRVAIQDFSITNICESRFSDTSVVKC